MADRTSAAGWWSFAGHRWPIERVELQHGVLRFVVACVATHNVPAGTSAGEMYGADGALVFRNPDMPHGDIWAGQAGVLIINFGMPQIGANGDIDEAAMDMALMRLMELPEEQPASMADIVSKARHRWKIWRCAAIAGWTIVIGTAAMTFGVPWWIAMPAECCGSIAAGLSLHLNRDWWKT